MVEFSKYVVSSGWGVSIYKSVSDLIVTIGQSRDMNFMDKIAFIGLNFIFLRLAQVKNYPFNFFVILERNKKETKENKR